ncbi:AAA family ATPase [Flavobacterium columnare]|uniref:AAA family ATPase n=1 Tax=Flavobacterium columnare TaxID=996 RepID=UPI001783A2D1|nr:AAA family ATPase [Flavobacterium columnare]QOG88832.1 AAA family ATPase [Flavobacterium columnare]QOG91491.1 AAA family ATPase [Flavobacterium columnare]QOG94154.1 AAA family ATPase [Flavobacterium columnare]QOG96813.1 AAA family ATPase [Flavobacterium columnare]QOG99471.1 AAA family ATPase [Flavobacterium columnare]
MELLYLWVRKYKNIEHQGFNLSSKVTFETIVNSQEDDDTLNVTLTHLQNEKYFSLFPNNIIDVKAVIGENGSGKTNLLEAILDFFLGRRNNFKGFLVTSDKIIIRDRLNFVEVPKELFGKTLDFIYPEDISNFYSGEFKRKLPREEAYYNIKNNLMETYFKKNYIIKYASFINMDNIHNVDGIENDYARFENKKPNFINIATESMIVSDYESQKSNERYMVAGESELLAHKYQESLRMLDFLNIVNNFNFKIEFYIESINVNFTDFGERFWKSVDKIISPNSESYEQSIEKILKFETLYTDSKDKEGNFFKHLSRDITYCFLSYELKHNFNFSKQDEFPIVKLIDNLKGNYNSKQDRFDALYSYIEKNIFFSENAKPIIKQIKEIKEYFINKFKSGEIICDEIYGFKIPKEHINRIASDFLNPPLNYIKITDERHLILNVFGFNYNGLSTGERNFLSFFSRIKEYKIKENRDILFVIDEGELGFHPQWQKKYLNFLLDFFEKFFPKNRVQLILTTHSPFIVSDLPKENIIFLKRDKYSKTEVSDITYQNLTFGANIHDILANDFFLQDGFMGEFAKNEINKVIDFLTDKKIKNKIDSLKKEINAIDNSIANSSNENEKKDLEIDRKNLNQEKNALIKKTKNVPFSDKYEKDYCKNVIDIIGEPILSFSLIELYTEAFPDEKKRFIDDQIKRLQNL